MQSTDNEVLLLLCYFVNILSQCSCGFNDCLHVYFTDTSIHYYVMLLRSGVNIIASRCVSTQNSMVLGCLELPGQIVMNCVPCDFTAYLDVYAMVCAVQIFLCLVWYNICMYMHQLSPYLALLCMGVIESA